MLPACPVYPVFPKMARSDKPDLLQLRLTFDPEELLFCSSGSNVERFSFPKPSVRLYQRNKLWGLMRSALPHLQPTILVPTGGL